MRHGCVLTVFKALFLLGDFVIRNLLEWLNNKKENVLQPMIRRWWPRFITPNMLTGFRIIVGGLILWPLAMRYGFVNNDLILYLLILAAITDLIDGPVARALNQTSDHGSLLDKIADKFLILPLGVVEFLAIDPLLAFVSVFGMCIIMYTTISKYLSPEHQVPPENIYGKFAMTFYCLAIIFALWQEIWQAAQICGWVGFTLGCVSAIDNFRKQYNINS